MVFCFTGSADRLHLFCSAIEAEQLCKVGIRLQCKINLILLRRRQRLFVAKGRQNIHIKIFFGLRRRTISAVAQEEIAAPENLLFFPSKVILVDMVSSHVLRRIPFERRDNDLEEITVKRIVPEEICFFLDFFVVIDILLQVQVLSLIT